jgi:hypothetical protein
MSNRPLLRSQKRDRVILDDFNENEIIEEVDLVNEVDPNDDIYADEINELPNETIDDSDEINEERLSQSLRFIHLYNIMFQSKFKSSKPQRGR